MTGLPDRRDCWIDIETGEWGLLSNLRLVQQTDLPQRAIVESELPADVRKALLRLAGIDSGIPADRRAETDRLEAKLKYVKDLHTAATDREKWCISGDCPDTNWGGNDRLHFRGTGCPPFSDKQFETLRRL